MKVVDKVAAADDEDALLPQWRKALADFMVEGRRLGFVNAELNYGNVCLRVHVAQHRPRPVIQSPAFIKSHWQRGEQFLEPKGKLRVAGRRILHLIQFPREPAEIVDCPWSGAHRHGSIFDVPMR
jgi:hypothetical protein